VGTCISLAIVAIVTWGVHRIVIPRFYQCLAGLALITFYFKYVISWIVAVEEVQATYFVDYQMLLFGIFFLGVDLLIYSWWRNEKPK